MRNFLKWWDENILTVISAFLLIFIPLYPKLPLFDALPGYIVRVRLEDILIFITIAIWLIWFIRGKISLFNNPLFKPISSYLAVGLISMISAVFLTQTVPFESLHINKMILHYLRRIEYFSLFFIFYSSVKNLKTIRVYLGILIITVFAVSIYGFGQRYLYWPAFSTMNREFSKGWMLYLTPHARVLSTFGGHYDLAAYIMMALILLWSVFFGVRGLIMKVIVFLAIAVSFWTLILTASRTSFIAYIIGLTLMFFLWSYKKGIKWSLSRWITVVILSIVIMLSFGDLSERFTKFLRIDDRLSGIKSLLFSPIGRAPNDKALFLENNPEGVLAQITSKSDQPPSLLRPSDVYQDLPLMIPDASGSSVTAKSRTYSKTAFIYDLSTAIRLDALWPQAIKGFQLNPIVGSGYSTLNKLQLKEFTEAESTDNDYLRSLGETGILGFVTFFGTLLIILYYIWKNLSLIHDRILFSVSAGLGGIILGLMVNAVYIDVFESSKVAFSFWALTGLVLAALNIATIGKKATKPVIYDIREFMENLKRKFIGFVRSDFFILIIILLLAFALRIYKIQTPLADWHSWRQSDTSSVTRNYVKHGINILFPTYDDISNVASGRDNPKGLRFVEFPLYNVVSLIVDKIIVGYTVEVSGRLTSVFSSLFSIIFLFLLVRKYIGRRVAVLTSVLYAILPYNIFFTRVILPEPFLVFTTLGMIYFTDKWIDKSSKFKVQSSKFSEKLKIALYLLFALIFTTSSILVKPFAIFLALPMIYLWFKGLGFSLKTVIGLLVYWVICLLPFIWWRIWISHFPEGVPAYMWLLNGDNIRFKGAFFYWIFADRLARLILGYWGLPLLIFGILAPFKKEKWLFYFWGIGILLYLTVVATGNVRHDYYQIITIPILVIFMSKGIIYLWDMNTNLMFKMKAFCIITIAIIFTEMFGWYFIRDLYNINHPEIVEAGRAVEKNTHDKALVIAPYNGDTAFLYQTNRAGWPVIQNSLDYMIERGADYYVSVNFDDLTNQLVADSMNPDLQKRKYKLIEKTDKYVIIQLVSDNKLPR